MRSFSRQVFAGYPEVRASVHDINRCRSDPQRVQVASMSEEGSESINDLCTLDLLVVVISVCSCLYMLVSIPRRVEGMQQGPNYNYSLLCRSPRVVTKLVLGPLGYALRFAYAHITKNRLGLQLRHSLLCLRVGRVPCPDTSLLRNETKLLTMRILGLGAPKKA